MAICYAVFSRYMRYAGSTDAFVAIKKLLNDYGIEEKWTTFNYFFSRKCNLTPKEVNEAVKEACDDASDQDVIVFL